MSAINYSCQSQRSSGTIMFFDSFLKGKLFPRRRAAPGVPVFGFPSAICFSRAGKTEGSFIDTQMPETFGPLYKQYIELYSETNCYLMQWFYLTVRKRP